MGQERRYVLKSTRPAPKTIIDYAAALNAEQLAVVEAPVGPVLCIAGAGSGKTRTLTYRVARLLERGLPPESILVLTFTNKAAREMLGRVTELCGPLADARRIVGGTFHHAAYALVREHAALLGYPRGVGILDREDARDLMEACAAELGLTKGPRRFPKGEVLVDLCSAAVNTQSSLPTVIAKRRPHFFQLTDEIVACARRFVQRKRALGLCDFDDLLLHWKLLLLDHPEVRSKLQARFRAVLVDEYQDTNRLQGEIVDLLAQGHRNVTAVGDDAQSIYSFRGADFTNIIEFPARYPGAQVFQLTRNYRSTPQILGLANASIARNRVQFPKRLQSERAAGPLPALVPLRDVFQQAEFVAQRLLELRDEGVPLGEVAVLYRAHAHSLELQLELARRGIPFQVRSGVRFTETAHVKDVLAHLRFLAHPADELAFLRVVRLVPGVGAASAASLWADVSARAGASDPLHAFLSDSTLDNAPPKAREGLAALLRLLRRLDQPQSRAAPGESIRQILEGGYREVLEQEYLDSAESRAQDLEQLSEYAAQYRELEPFLAEIALLNDFSAEESRAGEAPDERVVLSSVHQAKGLEWRAVFVVWLADGRFPMLRASSEPGEEEEERRLFYVACTRARDELYLTHPLTADPRDRERVILRVSRFVDELPAGEGSPYDRVVIDTEPEAALPAAPAAPALPAPTPSEAPEEDDVA